MKRYSAFIFVCVAGMLLSGCSLQFKKYEALVRPSISVEDAVANKIEIDATTNPAKKYLLSRELTGKILRVNDALVKDIISSTDVDYQFCVVATVQHEKGAVDIYIYTKDYTAVSKLEKGKTHVSAIGDVRRFFSLLDSSFLKIDMVDSDIVILD